MAHKFQLGQAVTNFGQVATVWAYHTAAADGRETGLLILRDDGGMKWVADPDKCQPVADAVRHTNGFVTF